MWGVPVSSPGEEGSSVLSKLTETVLSPAMQWPAVTTTVGETSTAEQAGRPSTTSAPA